MVVLAGCGATPPQVPKPQVSLLAHSISELGTHCGHAQIATALEGDNRRELRDLDRKARFNASQLVSVLRRGPDRIYEGSTVQNIAKDEETQLQKCGLTGAASLLQQTLRG